MDRTLQRCLVGSTASHAALLLLILLAGGLAARKVIEPDVPVLEIIPTDLRLTMGDQIGGGTPNPRPVAQRDRPGPPAAAAQPAPVTQPPAQSPPLRESVTPPVTKPEVKPSPVKAPPPKIELAKDARPVAKAQDVDVTKLAVKPVKIATASPVQVSTAKRRRLEEDQRAEAAETASASRAREQRLSSARSLAERLSGAASGVSKNVGTSTTIEMPGPGGAAYAPYYSYLQAFLKQQWRKPPTSSERESQVTVELRIARSGAVISSELIRRSGNAALDSSVEELFRRLRSLRPLPDEFSEQQLVVPVKFVLESSVSP